jgi:hypothetical protein
VKGGESKRDQPRTAFGWLGVLFLFLIVAIKAIRMLDKNRPVEFLIGIAPSLLGPIGLLFLLLSSNGRLSRLPLLQLTLFVGVLSVGLEFAQLLPRPGILERVHYTFDWHDVLASVVSVCLAYGAAHAMIKRTTGRLPHG